MKGKKSHFLLFILLSALHFNLWSPLQHCFLLFTIPLAHYKTPIPRHLTFSPAQNPICPSFKVSTPVFNSMAPLNNNFFQEFMWTFMEKTQALTTLAALAAKARDKIDRPLRSRNPDLYYGYLHIDYYYFC